MPSAYTGDINAIRGLVSLSSPSLMEYNKYNYGTYNCSSCRRLIDEYHYLRTEYSCNSEVMDTCRSILESSKFMTIRAMFNDYLGDFEADIYGCKSCMNEALLDFGTDLDLEDSERDHDYTRELKNLRLHYAHHGSNKNSKANKKNKPISRHKKYRDVSVV